MEDSNVVIANHSWDTLVSWWGLDLCQKNWPRWLEYVEHTGFSLKLGGSIGLASRAERVALEQMPCMHGALCAGPSIARAITGSRNRRCLKCILIESDSKQMRLVKLLQRKKKTGL